MADPAFPQQASAETVPLYVSADRVAMRVLPPLRRYSFRGDADAALACRDGFGVALPMVANRAAVAGDKAALWLGPDEWLLLCPVDEPGVQARLMKALGSIPHSLVDISSRQVAIEVAGPQAAVLLNAGVLLDLDEVAFPVNAATRTIFAKTEIILWRKAADVFHIEIWRSFAPYFKGLMAEASRGMPT